MEGAPELPGNEGIEQGEESLEVVYVLFSSAIYEGSAESLLNELSRCATQGAREVRLLMSTLGGNVSAGLTLYNVLRGLPFHLVTHNVGNVASIGVAVYLAGDERLTCANSTFLTHGVTNEAPANQGFGARWFRERHDAILADEAKINDILIDRTSLTAEELAAVAETEQTKDTPTAIAEGIAHRSEEVDIPEGAFVLTVPT